MAKMIDKIPGFEGEKITWESFSKNLPQQYVVYNTRSIKGWEFDFCILAEDIGLFIVEVKMRLFFLGKKSRNQVLESRHEVIALIWLIF